MAIDKGKIKELHALAAQNGLIVNGDRSDFKALVLAVCGKDSVSKLNDKEYAAVYSRILSASKTAVPGMMSCGQIKKAWAIMYQLCDVDANDTPVKMRMAGAIKAILHVDIPNVGDIFRWITYKQGNKLIEQLKRYLISAKNKAG